MGQVEAIERDLGAFARGVAEQLARHEGALRHLWAADAVNERARARLARCRAQLGEIAARLEALRRGFDALPRREAP